VNSGTTLRLARQARGFSQQQLAGMAGVSRQAVSAVESGQSDPSLRVALALAQALGMTVDELFGAEAAVPTVTARPVGTGAVRPPGERVTLAPIGDSFVALPLAGPTVSKAGFLPAGGLIAEPSSRGELGGRGEQDGSGGSGGSGGQVTVQPIGPPGTTLVIAGCDPALPLLEEPLGLLDPPIAFSWWPCGSREALRLAAAGLVHVAGVHLMGESGGYNTGPAAELLAQGGEVIGFSAWREGLVLRPDLVFQVESFADVARAGLRVVNRELGSEARSVLDRELTGLGLVGDDVPGYDAVVTGHLQVADAVAAGLAEYGVASEPAALAYGLAFIPLAAEQFDLVIPAERVASREVQALIKVLSSRWLLDQLASLPGYDTTPCGQAVFSQARAQAY
jgi:molybdate-binding protein/transcriptional regulator with XRE-family HTH domain